MAEASSGGTAVVDFPGDTHILITREFDAPSPLAYAAWMTPELIKRWWSGDRGEVMVKRYRRCSGLMPRRSAVV
jgi:hypothetical protein